MNKRRELDFFKDYFEEFYDNKIEKAEQIKNKYYENKK